MSEERTPDRRDILLRAAYDLIKRSMEPGFVQETCAILTHYDDADCDGSCLMDDIKFELDLPEGTKPIPLEETE